MATRLWPKWTSRAHSSTVGFFKPAACPRMSIWATFRWHPQRGPSVVVGMSRSNRISPFAAKSRLKPDLWCPDKSVSNPCSKYHSLSTALDAHQACRSRKDHNGMAEDYRDGLSRWWSDWQRGLNRNACLFYDQSVCIFFCEAISPPTPRPAQVMRSFVAGAAHLRESAAASRVADQRVLRAEKGGCPVLRPA